MVFLKKWAFVPFFLLDLEEYTDNLKEIIVKPKSVVDVEVKEFNK